MNEIRSKFPMKIGTSKGIDDDGARWCPGCDDYLESSAKVFHMGDDYYGLPIIFCKGCIEKAFKLTVTDSVREFLGKLGRAP